VQEVIATSNHGITEITEQLFTVQTTKTSIAAAGDELVAMGVRQDSTQPPTD